MISIARDASVYSSTFIFQRQLLSFQRKFSSFCYCEGASRGFTFGQLPIINGVAPPLSPPFSPLSLLVPNCFFLLVLLSWQEWLKARQWCFPNHFVASLTQSLRRDSWFFAFCPLWMDANDCNGKVEKWLLKEFYFDRDQTSKFKRIFYFGDLWVCHRLCWLNK